MSHWQAVVAAETEAEEEKGARGAVIRHCYSDIQQLSAGGQDSVALSACRCQTIRNNSEEAQRSFWICWISKGWEVRKQVSLLILTEAQKTKQQAGSAGQVKPTTRPEL